VIETGMDFLLVLNWFALTVLYSILVLILLLRLEQASILILHEFGVDSGDFGREAREGKSSKKCCCRRNTEEGGRCRRASSFQEDFYSKSPK
jgi:hypothetical protein